MFEKKGSRATERKKGEPRATSGSGRRETCRRIKESRGEIVNKVCAQTAEDVIRNRRAAVSSFCLLDRERESLPNSSDVAGACKLRKQRTSKSPLHSRLFSVMYSVVPFEDRGVYKFSVSRT